MLSNSNMGANVDIDCILKCTVCSHWVQKMRISKHFPEEFLISIAGFKSSSIQRGVHLVNDGPI